MSCCTPVSQVDLLNREINRAFAGLPTTNAARNAFINARTARNFPAVNIAEDADTIFIEALAPGVDPDSLQITILRNQITIAGEKPTVDKDVTAENYHRNERPTGKFVRTFTLPTEVDDTKVQAEYRDGILRLTLPKSEAAKPKRVAVSVG
ncbi:Hsp20/alpha crystallin family protein [soil metagenome]